MSRASFQADVIARTGAFDWAAIQGVRLVREHGFPVHVSVSLIIAIFASNIGGSATIVGDPTNIIVSSAGDIDFVEFLINIVPVSVASMAMLMILLFIWFRNDVKASDDKRQEILERSPSDAIRLCSSSLTSYSLPVAPQRPAPSRYALPA